MRSSTLRRSNLTREKIAMLQAIANYANNSNYTDYYQNAVKDKELEMLWSFKNHAKMAEKSVVAYFTTGFFAGVVVTLIMTTLISCLVNYSSNKADDFKLTPKEQKMEKIALEPADASVAAVSGKYENYEVKSGDTLAGIVMRFYGIYSIDKMDAIQKANGMKSPNELSIGQKLIIPLD